MNGVQSYILLYKCNDTILHIFRSKHFHVALFSFLLFTLFYIITVDISWENNQKCITNWNFTKHTKDLFLVHYFAKKELHISTRRNVVVTCSTTIVRIVILFGRIKRQCLHSNKPIKLNSKIKLFKPRKAFDF